MRLPGTEAQVGTDRRREEHLVPLALRAVMQLDEARGVLRVRQPRDGDGGGVAVQGSRRRDGDLGVRVQGLGFRGEGLGFRV